MNEREFNIDNLRGLKNHTIYENIDIYVDILNTDNIWGLVRYIDFIDHKPVKKQEIIRFTSEKDMMNYIRSHFDSYELNRPVDINSKRVFFHYIDYCDMKYLYYDGKPQKNHIEVTYNESENGFFVRKKSSFPKEYEDIFVEILKVSKNIPLNKNLDSRYRRDVDVYAERSDNRKEILRSISMSIDELSMLSKGKLKGIKNSKKLVKGIKVFVSTATLAAILATGYSLQSKNAEYSDYLKQSNGLKNVKDMSIYINKGNTGLIIEKLMNGEYGEVSPDDLKTATEFIKTIEERNYDRNDSFNSFNYSDYFKYKVGDSKTFYDSSVILGKIERLYNNCFILKDKLLFLDKEGVKKYINYVGSLSFMYDTYHTDRPLSYVSMETQSITSIYANEKEIAIFDSYPPILRYIILTQLKNVLYRSTYEIEKKPSYYFGETDKYGLLNELNKKIDSLLDEMYYQCGYRSGNRK